jgi:hypothetical protein
MTTEPQPLDITNEPRLSRVADEVRKARRPQIWRQGNQDVAMLVPLASRDHATITPVPYNPKPAAVLAGLSPNDPVARTAGALHIDQPFPGYDEENEAAAIAIAHDLVAYRQQ